ncbi:MAG TPA: hemolysin III family protein [Rectinemataceae bacterium]|nr:hemolysin III family protein [Rectinemataceae bacterium]
MRNTGSEAGKDRRFSAGEEIANAVTHGTGALLSVGAMLLLVLAAIARGSALTVAAYAVFGLSLILLFTMSTIYHALAQGRAKKVFEVLDHSSIYLLIAGTYTVFCVGPLRQSGGGNLLALVWAIAAAGIVFKSLWIDRFKLASTLAYLAMGWLLAPYFGALRANLNGTSMALLLAGGLFYTLGAVFYSLKRIPWFHPVWHLFVLAGAACHVAAALAALSPMV